MTKILKTNLLEKVSILSFKHKNQKNSDNFNIFSLLKKKFDEVHLHSRFIFELLNPQGSHEQNRKFLDAFLEVIGIEDFGKGKVITRREYKNIDIFIGRTNKSKAIIIENKTRPQDQDKQLERYYKTLLDEKYEQIWIIYLSMTDDEPSENSVGKLGEMMKTEENLIQISYSFHIINWIEKCINITSRLPKLRETLVQYQELIKKLTNQTMEVEQRLELLELLGQNDNIFDAHKIASNWIHIKWHTEHLFWEEFQAVIEDDNYIILDVSRYHWKKLNLVIHRKNNRKKNSNFGFLVQFASFNNYQVCK